MKRKIVVYTSIVGDLFHIGHLSLLRRAKELGDYLIVGVITDKGVEAYKRRPIFNIEQRIQIVSSIKYVDEVMLQKQRDGSENLKKIKVDILVRGNDAQLPDETNYIKSIGGQLIQLPYTDGISTTEIIKKVQSMKVV